MQAGSVGGTCLKTTLFAILLVSVTFSPFVPVASASGHSEAAILSAYLATGDHFPGTPHCGRTPNNNAHLDQHVAWHRTYAPSSSFLVYHHQLVHAYESWRALAGHPALVSWDPSTALPSSFAVHAGCPARATSAPGIALPSWASVAGGSTPDPVHGHRSLCAFVDDVQLGQSLLGWHDGVHVTVGGDMGSADLAPRDPAFWAWHRFLDDVYHTWQRACDKEHVVASGWINENASPCYQTYDMYALGPHALHREHGYDGYAPPGPYYERCRATYDAYYPCYGIRCPEIPCVRYDCPLDPYRRDVDDVYYGGYRGVRNGLSTLDGLWPNVLRRSLPAQDVVTPWLRAYEPTPPPRVDACESAGSIEAGGYYVILDRGEDGLSPSVWVYQESNSVRGLQRADERCDQTGEGEEPDVVVL